MLKPAIIYKEEIVRRFCECATDDMLYYSGSLGCSPPEIADAPDESSFQYAIVDGDKLVGYLTYMVDWYTSCARCFGLISFERNNTIIGVDVFKELRKLINEYHIHRLEWRMIGGNPVEKHYDRFCLRYGGRKLVLNDAIRDRQGRYHDDMIYEIVFRNRRSDNG